MASKQFGNVRTFDVCVAMCDSNRGIGLGGNLPWPKIQRDYDHYIKLTGTPQKPDMLSFNIRGHKTWEVAPPASKSRRNVINIVISKTLRAPLDDYLYKICPSLPEAWNYLQTSAQFRSQIDSVWIMGGQQLYEEAVDHPDCKRIYLTRIFGHYQSDRFFPKIESRFDRIDNPVWLDSAIQDQNGVQFQFEVHERTPHTRSCDI